MMMMGVIVVSIAVVELAFDYNAISGIMQQSQWRIPVRTLFRIDEDDDTTCMLFTIFGRANSMISVLWMVL
jgi:hypothetical protein